MASFNQRCQQAIRRAVSEQGRSDQITLFPDQLHGVTGVAPRAQPEVQRSRYFTIRRRARLQPSRAAARQGVLPPGATSSSHTST